MKYSYLFIFLFIINSFAGAQNPIGLAQITNFTTADYKGGNQNWDIEQDAQGIMYFANNEGLLTYNGQTWNIYPVPSNTVIRSVKIGPDGKIYVGAQDDFGYFFPDSKGVLRYTSLKYLIPKANNSFADVWNISIDKSRIFFRTNAKIFELYDGRITTFNSNPGWLFLGKCNNSLYAQERTSELKKFDGNKWSLVCMLPANLLITSIAKYSGDTILVATLKDGLFLLSGNQLITKSTPADNLLKNDRINALQAIDTGLYAVGTAFNGCLVIDKNGNLVETLSNLQSLQKNNVRSLHLDHDKNIWLGLDDGISFIAFNNAIKQIYPDVNKQSSTYAVRVFNKTLYIGTSDAVFALPLTSNKKDLSYSYGNFIEVQNTKGQVWSLNEINNHLIFGNEDGAYSINNYLASPLYNYPGTWLFKPLSSGAISPYIIAGTYEGLHLLNYAHNNFVDNGRIEGLIETLRFLTIDYSRNTIWSSHPYRGVYKILLTADSKKIARYMLYTQKDGLPSSLHNYVFNIKGRNVVATINGIYEYDYKTNRFSLSKYFYPMFKHNELQYLNEDKNGNIWFIGNKKVGVIDFSKSAGGEPFTVVDFPELTSKVLAGFENIYPYDDENIFIGSNNGVFHINYKQYQSNRTQLNTLLAQVKVIGDKDSVIFGGYFINKNTIQSAQNKDSILVLPHRFNSFHFEFSTTMFAQHSNIEFSYQLVGFDNKWSAWNAKSEKEYTNLGPGIYTFRVKARTNLGSESKYVTYTFEIKPAWYETYAAYFLYIWLACSIVYGIIKIQQEKHRKAEIHLRYVHQLELEHSENEIVALKNEKLEAEVDFKNKELATTTMHLVQRGKLMSKIKEGLMQIKDAELAHKQDELLKVLRLINDAERNDSDWDHFAIHFDQVHSDFLTKLKNKFPELSQNDLKMCAYLKMNLSSKEIAQLLSVTIRAVEVSRYRLRKKLNLPSNVNLFDYILQETNKEG
jgi:ligand-binding sensor domain-containing protein/DNA-binding CsgD family transcriptional regulator